MEPETAKIITALVPAIIAATLLLGVLLLLLRRIGRRNRHVGDDPALWQDRGYRCPDCGTAMQPGWVLLGKGAIWSDRDRGKPGTFAHIGSALPSTLSLRIPPEANMAWRCEACRMLLIDHGKLVR